MGRIMKESDITQGRRLARLIDQLTRGGHPIGLSVDEDGVYRLVSITLGNPDCQTAFDSDSVIGCLLAAMKSRGLTEEAPPGGLLNDETQLSERAKSARSIADQVMAVLRLLSDYSYLGVVAESREKLRFLQIEAENFAAEQEAEYRAF